MSGFADAASGGGTRTLDTHDPIPATTGNGPDTSVGTVPKLPERPPAEANLVPYLQARGAIGYKVVGGQAVVVYPWDHGMTEEARTLAASNPEFKKNNIDVPVDAVHDAGLTQLIYEADYERSRLGKGQASTAGAYMASETDKANEVTRQFEDFLKRAKGVYDLRDSEQQFAMRADDQNAQNMKNAREGLITYPGAYTVPTMDTAYSRILAPTVPESVKPIYNLNGAVGLPGPEGFNDAQYNSTTGAPLTQTPAIPKELWGSSNPVLNTKDGQPLYADENGNLTTTPPTSAGYAFGTDYHAMLMRKLITGGRYA